MRRNGKDQGAAPQGPAQKDGRDGVRGRRPADTRKGSPVHVPLPPELRPIIEEESRQRREEANAMMSGTTVVEVLSAEPNRVVLRVPWRRYPGALIQGDDLSALCCMADRACEMLLTHLSPRELTFGQADGIVALLSLRDDLHEIDEHYSRSTRVHDRRHTAALRLIRAREEHS